MANRVPEPEGRAWLGSSFPGTHILLEETDRQMPKRCTPSRCCSVLQDKAGCRWAMGLRGIRGLAPGMSVGELGGSEKEGSGVGKEKKGQILLLSWKSGVCLCKTRCEAYSSLHNS